MDPWKPSAAPLLGLLLLAGAAVRDDAADIRQATLEHFATLNAGDAAGHVRHHAAGHSVFRADGGALEELGSLEEQERSLRDLIGRGFKSSQEVRDLKVHLYGDAAVVTGYVTGTVTRPGGGTVEVRERRTAVLVREGGAWKEVHLHSSPWSPPAPRAAVSTVPSHRGGLLGRRVWT